MIILGIDPGTISVGYALVEARRPEPKLLDYGLLPIGAAEQERRLQEIQREVQGLVRRWRPGALALEKIFFAKNHRTALAVAEARGVIMLTSALAGLKVFEYTPLEIKKTITGDGRADKLQIKKMLCRTTPELAGVSARDDVFDAVAAALTLYYKERLLIS